MHLTSTFLLLIFLSLTPATAQNADATLESFFKTYLEKTFEMRPLDATMLGDHRFDDKLDDISPKARSAWLALATQTLRDLPKSVAYDQISRDHQIDYEILRDDLSRSIWLTENTHPFEEDPRTYGGYISDSVYTLLVQSTLPKETNIKNAIARMALIPGIIAVAQTTLQAVPRTILDTAILQNRGAISFYEDALFTLAGATPQLPALHAAAKPVVAALRKYQAFLESDLRKKATDHWRMGRDKFARKVELELDTGRTASEVLADAEAEFDRVQRDMYVIARQLWGRCFPKEPLPPDDAQGRHDTIAHVIRAISHEHGTPGALITDTRATVNRIKAFIKEHDILRLPEPDRCQILEMPEFRRGNSVAYLEPALPLDPSGPSTYAVSPPPSDWKPERVQTFLEEYNKYMLQVLTIHEAYPGHYVQLEYSNRCPSLIRQVLQSGTFKEGWAVYTEQMMLDQGYGGGDLSLRLSQLKFYLRAVVNSILDHKMHCTAMTDEEAMALLTQGAFQSEGEARLKIIRSKQSTAQLSTYFAGRMAIYRLRQQIQRELGDKFDLGRFHEAVMAHGSLPVKFLPRLVRTSLAHPTPPK